MNKRKSKVDFITSSVFSDVDEVTLEKLYTWVDEVPFTRPKKNIARDFSDGVLAAELIKFYVPKIVELHNYTPSMAMDKKVGNWTLLNKKALHHFNLELSPEVIRGLCQARPLFIENILIRLKERIELHLAREKGGYSQTDRPEVDQHTVPTTGSPRRGVPPFKPANTRALVPEKDFSGDGSIGQLPPPSIKANAVLVPRAMLVEREYELQRKTETLAMLQSKVEKLEHLLRLKDMKLEDLNKRFDKAERALSQQGGAQLISPSVTRKVKGPSASGSEESILQQRWK